MNTNNQNNGSAGSPQANSANMDKNSATAIIRRIWRVIRIPMAIIVILFIGLVIYRIPVVKERMKTEEVVKKIQGQKLTLADVMGQNLPPEPDVALKDATLEGVDANNNGIRDDVELAIFKLHPDSARIRAAELQYAMALQMYLVNVSNGDTFTTASNFEDLSAFCIAVYLLPPDPSASDEQRKINNEKAGFLINEVKELVLNTAARRNKHENIPQGDSTMYSDSVINNRPNCDIDLMSLPN